MVLLWAQLKAQAQTHGVILYRELTVSRSVRSDGIEVLRVGIDGGFGANLLVL